MTDKERLLQREKRGIREELATEILIMPPDVFTGDPAKYAAVKEYIDKLAGRIWSFDA